MIATVDQTRSLCPEVGFDGLDKLDNGPNKAHKGLWRPGWIKRCFRVIRGGHEDFQGGVLIGTQVIDVLAEE